MADLGRGELRPAARLGNELNAVMEEHRRKGTRASTRFRLDDANDALLSGLVALYAAVCCFVEIGVSHVDVFRGVAGVDAACLVGFCLVTIALHRFLRVFPNKERERMVVSMIERLRTLDESVADTPGIGSRFEQKRNVEFSTATKRGNIWRNIPNNLLVKGDRIALQAGSRAPANVSRVFDGRATQRDARVGPAKVRTDRTLQFLELVDVEEYDVLESPLVSDVAFFLNEGERAQETEIGRQIEALSKQLRLVAAIGFVVFGLALGGARYAIRPDGYDFDRLILLRSATLICFLPCLSWPFFRFAFEMYSYRKMTSLVGEGNGNPLGFPVIPSTLVRTMGSLTALCGLDEDTLLLDAPAVEEVFLLKGGRKTQVIDCCLDNTLASGLRFEDPQWKNHFSSLKPLGLACALANETAQSTSNSAQPKTLEEIFQQRITPKHLSQLASTMGFHPEDLLNFHVRSRCTVISSPEISFPSSSIYPAAHILSRPIVECIVVEMPDQNHHPSSSLVNTPGIMRTASDIGPSSSSKLSVSTKNFMNSISSRNSSMKSASLVDKGVPLSRSSSALSDLGGPTQSLGINATSLANTQTIQPKNQKKLNESTMMSKHVQSTKHPLAADTFEPAEAALHENVVEDSVENKQLPRRSASSSNIRSNRAPLATRPSSESNGGKLPAVPLTKSDSIGPRLEGISSAGAGKVSASVSSSSFASRSGGGSRESSGALHLICWGSAPLLTSFCSEYWDGESIWTLDEDTRVQVKKMSAQWEKEDFDCVAFAYGPLSVPQLGDRNLFLSSPFVDDAFVVLDAPIRTTPSQLAGIPRAPTPPQQISPTLNSSSSPLNSHSTPKALERKIQVICGNLARGLILTGMIGARDQPAYEVSSLVELLHKCGIRFVYFSPREARCGRKIAEKMGLETDWNTSISLASPEEIAVPSGNANTVLLGHHSSSYSYNRDVYGDWEQKARMPKGIDAIKRHIVEVDDVPLRVSVFTECVPGTVAEMIEVLRDRTETVAVFGNPVGGVNLRAFLRANVGVAVYPHWDSSSASKEMKLSMDLGRIGCSFNFCESKNGVLLSLLGEGRIALYNYRQGNQCLVALGLIGFISQIAVLCAAAPDMFTLGHTLWLVWVQIPLMACPPALRPRNRQMMLWERMPWKQSALVSLESENSFLRYIVYALVRLTPVATFVAGIFFWTLITLDANAANELAWSSSPPLDVNSLGNVTYDPTATQAAQSLSMLAFVWCGLFVSATFASRTEIEKDYELRFWGIWLGFALLVMGLQMAYNCVMSSLFLGSCTDGAFPSFPTRPAGEIWLVLLLCPPVFIPLCAIPVKRHDRKYYNRSMQMMRLDFETKLGQFSPK